MCMADGTQLPDLEAKFFLEPMHPSVYKLKEFILNQAEAYEFKIGDKIFRRPGDPPLDKVLEKLQKKKKRDKSSKDEL